MVVIFHFFWWGDFRKCENLLPFKPLATQRTVSTHIINIRIAILYGAVTIRVNKGMTTFRTIHKLFILLNFASFKFPIESISQDRQGKSFTLIIGILIGIVASILKRYDINRFIKEVFTTALRARGIEE